MKSLSILILATLLLFAGSAFAANNNQILEQITDGINQATTPQDKAQYFVYRARWYSKAGQNDSAMADFSEALKLDDKAWIRLERSEIFFRQGEYSRAIGDATFAKKQNSALASKADRIINKSSKEIKRENPETIVVGPHNRTARPTAQISRQTTKQIASIEPSRAARTHNKAESVYSKGTISAEQESLRLRMEKLLRGCNDKKGAGNRASCVNSIRAKYDVKFSMLRENPDLYFNQKLERQKSIQARREKRRNERSNIVINPFTGEVLNRAAGGYIGNDGTFYNDAAGGIVNSRTGEFTPTN